MNCNQYRDDFAAYQEGLLEPEAESRTSAHLAECPACRAEFDEMQSLVVRLTNSGLGASGVSLEAQVMDRIIHEQALVIRRLQMRKRIRLLGIGGVLTAAVVLLIIAGVQMTEPNNRAQAAEVLAQGAKAVSDISSIHIKGKMRTLPNDNFSNINTPDGDLVPIELWKQFGEKSKWRVEKPGRVVVMDGNSTIMLMKPKTAVKIPQATGSAFDTDWLLSLTNVRNLTKEELQSALAQKWDMKLAREQDNGAEKLVVTVEAKAGLGNDNYMKNKFIDTTDTRRVYRFDAETKRLEAIHIYTQEKGKDVLIFEANNIDFNKPIDPETFSLKLPEDVQWFQETAKLPDNEKYEKMTPKETAAAFFEACSKENWDELKKLMPIPIDDKIKEFLGGVQVISIGEPFQAKPYPGWFVPYEIKFKGGEVYKHNLAVRNDNAAKRYMFDGGL
jgi:outer membrane lipoprotein-sorting protein